MSEPLKVTTDEMNRWAGDVGGPVALHLKQKLMPVEGDGGVIFPRLMRTSGTILTSSPMAQRSSPSTALAVKPTEWSQFSSASHIPR